MKSRALRLTLLAIFLGSLGAAAYVVWQGERAVGRHRDGSRTFDDLVLAASRNMLELRSAQQGYVAEGQGEDYWISKVIGLVLTTGESLTAVRAAASAAETQAIVDEAAAALRRFDQMDRRARDYARSGQRLLASDMIYSDGFTRTDAVLATLARAQAAETAARDGVRQEIRAGQLRALAAAAAAGILVLVALVPLPRPAAQPGEPASAPAGAIAFRPGPAEPASATEYRSASWERPRVAPDPPAPAPAPPPAPAIDLQGVAALCTDLARLEETDGLPAALGRAADLLDAQGIVLWIADPAAEELSAIAAHGYTRAVVARLGTIPRDAGNVTAAAFRTGVVQTVRGDERASGAIAVPLLRPDGCVGVMAAEVREDGEQDGRLAVAAIVAAQLATLVGPGSAQTPDQAEVAGA
jgi:hypothetical protein